MSFKHSTLAALLALQLLGMASTSMAANTATTGDTADELRRTPLSPEQIKAIMHISMGVVSAHNSQGDDPQATEQLLAISKDLGEQIADESPSAETPQTSNNRREDRRAARRAKMQQWATQLQERMNNLKQGTSPWGKNHALRQTERLQRWSDELQALSVDAPAPDRLNRLRQLRESMRLSRYQRPDDAYIAPSPTMSMQSAKSGR